MSKKETKEWKKRIKALSPAQYKTLLDENKSLKGQVSSMRSELSGVDQTIQDKDDQIAQYQVQIDGLRTQVSEARAEAQKATEAAENQVAESPTRRGVPIQIEKGIVFKVQIGAFKNKDLSKYLNNSSNFSGEVDENGLIRYTLGVFRDYWEADTFKKYLREMGVSEAWIISYQDGKRVPIKDVLENVSKS
jgi:DNA repair exonuclease SbcCD ATPase subunit